MTVPLGILASSKSGTAIWTSPSFVSARWGTAAYNPYASVYKYWVGATLSSTNPQYSSDGVTWSSVSTAMTVAAIGYTTSYWVRNSGATMYYSTDGNTWSTATGSFGYAPKNIIWDGTRAIYSGNSGTTCRIAYSATGTNWSQITLSSTGGGQSIAYNGSNAYMITPADASTTGKVCTSDPTVIANWSAITLPAAAATWNWVLSNGSTWVMGSRLSTYYTSTNNGSTWTTRTLPTQIGESGDDWVKMFYADGLFYYYWSGNVYTSPDAVTWTATAIPGLSGTTPIVKCTAWLYDGVKVQGFGMALQGAAGNNQAPTVEYINGAY